MRSRRNNKDSLIEDAKNCEELEEANINSIVIEYINSKEKALSGEEFLNSVISNDKDKDKNKY